MRPGEIPVAELVPHGDGMMLLDALVSSTDDCTVAKVVVTRESEFAGPDGVPAYIGLEYMAQTVAARVGFEARQNGEPPPIGFLLGTRSYTCTQHTFPFGSELAVRVRPLLVDAGFGSFECTIELGDIVASAVLNTYRPDPDSLDSIGKE